MHKEGQLVEVFRAARVRGRMTKPGQTDVHSPFSIRAAIVAAMLVVAGCFTAAFTFASGDSANAGHAVSKAKAVNVAEAAAR